MKTGRIFWILFLTLLLTATILPAASSLFFDDFSDGDISDWWQKKPTWSAPAGDLIGMTSRRADIFSTAFAGCTNCSFEAVLRFETPGERISLMGWYVDRLNNVEIRLMHDKQKLLLKQKVGGYVRAKKAILLPASLSVGVNYTLNAAFTGSGFVVKLDGTILLTVTTGYAPYGTIGLRVKSTNKAPATGAFPQVQVSDQLSAVGGLEINLTSGSDADDQNPAFSPDGQQILFSSKRNGGGANLNLWRMNQDGSGPAAVTDYPDNDSVNLPGSSWNGAIDKICFSSDRGGHDNIWISDPDGSNAVNLTNDMFHDQEPTFSPNGDYLVFESDRDGNWEIYKLDVSTLVVTRLTSDPAEDREPNWSPAGDRIVFQSNRDGNWELYTMNADGSGAANLTNAPSAEDTDPSWSPDGDWIAYSSNRDGQAEPDIYVRYSNGLKPPHRVTFDPAYDGAPSFSPDGKSIAFESDRSGNLDIWITSFWNTVNDFAYQLQGYAADDLAQIGDSAFDLAVIDYSASGAEAERWTAQQIDDLKHSPGGLKLVLAYMSIGEAEDYRWYWHNAWDADHDGNPDPGAPSWLGPSNPDWWGNYKVRYWDPGWQSIIFGSPSSYVDKIIDAGFDGVYLDIIDAYEYWGPDGVGELDEETAEQSMVDFVRAIAGYARGTRGRPTFGVFPQNGEALVAHPEFLDVVNGIGREDTWYDGDDPQDPAETAYVLQFLDQFHAAGRLVLSVDYCTQPGTIDDFYSKAQTRGFVPYATVRDLDQLTINPGHEPD